MYELKGQHQDDNECPFPCLYSRRPILKTQEWFVQDYQQLGRMAELPNPDRQALASIFLSSTLHTPYSSSMADNKLKRKFSRSHSPSSKPRPSIHQSGSNATITIQGSYNDVGRDQNNTYILGGASSIIQSEQN